MKDHRFFFISGVCLQDKSWRNRRSQKLEKMELLNLQSALQMEIQAKQQISEELTKFKAAHVASEKYGFESWLFVSYKNHVSFS